MDDALVDAGEYLASTRSAIERAAGSVVSADEVNARSHDAGVIGEELRHAQIDLLHALAYLRLVEGELAEARNSKPSNVVALDRLTPGGGRK